MNEDRNLYIPQGLKSSSEIFTGFSKKELIRAIFIFLILLAVNLIIFLIKKNTVIFIVFLLSSLTASIMITQKDISNISVYDQIRFMIRFHKSQKYYKYKYLPEWGEKIEKK